MRISDWSSDVCSSDLRVAVFTGLHLMTKPDVPAAAVVGVVTGKDIHVRVDGDIVYVTHAVRIDFHFRAVGTYTNDSSAEHGQFVPVPIDRVVESEIAHSNINPTVNTHPDAIGRLIGSATLAEARVAEVFNQWFGRTISNTSLL